MIIEEEVQEGKKDARMDNLKGIKRDLSLYLSEGYVKGYKSYRKPRKPRKRKKPSKKKNKIKGGK